MADLLGRGWRSLNHKIIVVGIVGGRSVLVREGMGIVLFWRVALRLVLSCAGILIGRGFPDGFISTVEWISGQLFSG